MTRQMLIDFCLTFPAAYEDYPFDGWRDGGAMTVMRHRANQKIFAMIYERLGKLQINLKCDPIEADFLRQLFKDVTPGYHMNKSHWNTVTIDGDVSDETLKNMIESSFHLIKPKIKRND